MELLIGIPARYNSQRFPGKPLALLNGKTMLERVYAIARDAAQNYSNIRCIITTEDQRILDFCAAKELPCILSSTNCNTGTDRLAEIAHTITPNPDFVINLQGDNPLCPPWIVEAIIRSCYANPTAEIITPCYQLTWAELAKLQQQKASNPFSGTTAIINNDQQAIWFSKTIIPAIRNIAAAKQLNATHSPVLRHIGIYGYRTDVLQKIAALPTSYYEQYEGLEQLRFLENGLTIQTVLVDYRGRANMSGIDSPQDLELATQLLNIDGEF